MLKNSKRIIATVILLCLMISLSGANLFPYAAPNTEEVLLSLDFSDSSQIVNDQYGAHYSTRDVIAKVGDGSEASINLAIDNGRLAITEKNGWARPVVRFSTAFALDTVYRLEYTVEPANASQTLSVEPLIQITGSLDGNWPTAPDCYLPATVINASNHSVSMEFYFTNESGKITFHSGSATTSLPKDASIAAFDYQMMLGGSSTDCFVDDFVLKKVGSIVQDEDQPLFQTDFEQDNQMKDAYFDYSKNIWMKQGNGNDAAASFAIEQVADENGQDTNALLVSDRTSYARPIMRVDLPFEIGKTYRIAYAAKSKETGKKIALQSYIEITGALNGGYPTAPALDCGWNFLPEDGSWTHITTDLSFGKDGEKLTYTANGKTVELPEGATLAALDFNILAGGENEYSDYYLDDFTITEVKDTPDQPEEPEVTGIVANSFHSSDEINNDVNGFYAAPGVWSVNGADGTTTLTVEDSLLKITDRSGNRSPAVRLGGGSQFPSNKQYQIALRAKNLESGMQQSIGYYLQFTGEKDGTYSVVDFGTDTVALSDSSLRTVSADFAIEETEDGVTIVTANGSKSFDKGYSLAAIDVYLISEGQDSKASIGIDNFYADFYNGEIMLDFETDDQINNVNNGQHSTAYTMTKNIYGAREAEIVFVENAGADGSRVLHAIGDSNNWRPEIRLSQGTTKIKVGTPYELSFQAKSANPGKTTNVQIILEVYYTLPDAPNDYKTIEMMSTKATITENWETFIADFQLIQTEDALLLTDGISTKKMPANAVIAAVDSGFVPIDTTDKQTNYYVDNYCLRKLLRNPFQFNDDDANKIIKNGGMEQTANIGDGRAWYSAENADITLEAVTDDPYAGSYCLKVSNRKLVWHRAIQRLEDLSIFQPGKKFNFSGAVKSEEETIFSLSIYVTLGFRDENNPNNIQYAAMEIPLSTQHVGDSWKDMVGEFGIYVNADGNTVITNGNTEDPVTLEIPKDSIGIAAIDVYFGIPETYEKNVTTNYYIDNMEMVEAGAYQEGDRLQGTFVSLTESEEKENDSAIVLLYQDEATGIEIYGDAADIPAEASFQVEKLFSGSEYRQAEKALAAKKISGKAYYSITLRKDGSAVSPLGHLYIHLPNQTVSKNADQKLLLLADGNILAPKAELKENTYIIDTDILGIFALSAPADISADNSGTGENQFWLLMAIGCILPASMVLILFKKRKKGDLSA